MQQAAFQDAGQYLAMLHKRRGLLAACLGLSLLLTTVYNYTTRPLYKASAQILVDPRTPDVLPGRELYRGNLSEDHLNTQYQLLRGRHLAQRVVLRLGLHKRPGFADVHPRSLWERIRGGLSNSSASRATDEATAVAQAIAPFLSGIEIEPLPNSNLAYVRFVAADPELAAAAANALAEAFVEQSVTLRFTSSTDATEWLAERLADQRQRLEKAERALQRYEEGLGLANLDERLGLVEQKLRTLHEAMMAARTERIAKQTLYHEMKDLSPEQLEAFPTIMQSPMVQSLRSDLLELQREHRRRSESLGELHPDMLRLQSEIAEADGKVRAEIQKLVRSAENDSRTSQRHEENLRADLEPAQREMQQLRRTAVEHGVLKREVEANRQLFENLMSRTVETGVERELKTAPVRIVERAEVPAERFSPRRARNYWIALLAALALGIALVVLVEQMDNSVKTPEDVRELLQLPFLGMVPDVAAARGRGGASPLILDKPLSSLAEAYRVVRTNLIFSAPESGSRCLLVSSVNPAEGKSTTVTNLAVSLAQNGARVLVVDADLRRPVLDRHFGVPSTPGLSDLIIEKCAPGEAIRPTGCDGLHLIPCGYLPPNPAELLGSPRMRELLRGFASRFEWVLVDAPPILAIADAPVLSTFVDGLVLVVAADRTARPAVQRTIDQVTAVGGKIVGVVLNRLNLERNAYYFGQYYGKYYQSYYLENREPTERPPTPRETGVEAGEAGKMERQPWTAGEPAALTGGHDGQ